MKIILLFTVLGAIHLPNVSGQFSFPSFSVLSPNVTFYNYFAYANKSIADYGFQTVNPAFISFRLWTRNQTIMYVPLTLGQLASVSDFRKNKTVKIIVHGYLSSADARWVSKMKLDYLQRDDFNVILLNWQMPAMQSYPTAAGYVKDIGNYVFSLMKELNETVKIPYDNMHCIGHSLGAHICGFAGKSAKSANKNLGRISGLDPAGPLFIKATPDIRVNKTDAKTVDLIHTDNKYYGTNLTWGTIDFYPNGGEAPEPGCYTDDGSKDIIYGCSHRRAYKYFSESINTLGFVSVSCPSSANFFAKLCLKGTNTPMGENMVMGTTGTFFLTTNPQSPFAKNGVFQLL